jgi:hypothetical protein
LAEGAGESAFGLTLSGLDSSAASTVPLGMGWPVSVCERGFGGGGGGFRLSDTSSTGADVITSSSSLGRSGR